MKYAISIQMDSIDKSKLYNGKKGPVLDAILIETPDNGYGNSHVIIQSVSKADRAAGVKGKILGNAKEVGAAAKPSVPASDPTY
jgi:hypothetical protein